MTKPLVAVIDDNTDFLISVRFALKSKFSVTTFASTEDYISSLNDGIEYHVVLSDQQIESERSGTDLLKLTTQYLPLASRVMMTGHSNQAALLELVNDAGIDSFIRKPFAAAQILEVIESASKNYQLRLKASDEMHEGSKKLSDASLEVIRNIVSSHDLINAEKTPLKILESYYRFDPHLEASFLKDPFIQSQLSHQIKQFNHLIELNDLDYLSKYCDISDFPDSTINPKLLFAFVLYFSVSSPAYVHCLSSQQITPAVETEKTLFSFQVGESGRSVSTRTSNPFVTSFLSSRYMSDKVSIKKNAALFLFFYYLADAFSAEDEPIDRVKIELQSDSHYLISLFFE